MNVFENLNQFVLQGHDENADSFLSFLYHLSNRHYFTKYVIITPDNRGINMVQYDNQKTLQQYYKWSDIQRIVTDHYNSLKGANNIELQKAFM